MARPWRIAQVVGPAREPLLTRLAENEGVLIGACNLLTGGGQANRRIVPAGEWLLDNFYLIEEQIHTPDDTCQRVTAANCRAC